MEVYHKIQTVYLRDPETKWRTLLEGQYAKPEFEYLKDTKWQFTEKIDGTNIRVIIDPPGEACRAGVHFEGKTERAQIPHFLLDTLIETFRCEDFSGFENGVTLYGEGFGNKIQKVGKLYMPDAVGFTLFDVKIGHTWLQRGDVVEIAARFSIPVVPTVGFGTLDDMVDTVKRRLDSFYGPFTMEGLVARPVVELKDRGGHRIITKLKCKDFDGTNK